MIMATGGIPVLHKGECPHMIAQRGNAWSAMDKVVQPFDSVTVFGGATLDHVARSAARPVMGASNPGTAHHRPGGVGFNVAHVVARLGLEVRLVTRVGTDRDGEMILESARSAGVNTDGVIVSATERSAAYHATLDDTGNLIMGIADMSITEEISPASMALVASAREARELWVIDANLPRDTIAFLAGEAAAWGRPLAALTVSPAKAVNLTPILDRLDYLFTNRREAAALLGLDPHDPSLPVTRLAGDLAASGVTKVVVTNGHEPLAAASNGDVRAYAPFRAVVEGVNGAGDSFAAGTIRGLASGHGLNDAIRFGLAAAAMTLEAGSLLAAPFSEDALGERMGAGLRVTARLAS